MPCANAGVELDELSSSQNARSCSTRRDTGLPAISAALIAPIEMPATQLGSRQAFTSDSNTPAW